MGDRSRISIRLAALQRLVMWHLLSGLAPHYLVTEYPKSGGSWFAQMLSAYLGVPFPRDERPSSLLQPCVLHGHHMYSPHFRNVFCVVRDGRDVMVSAYYHMLFHHDRNPAWAVERRRDELQFDDYGDVGRNLPRFITYMFERAGHRTFRFRWDEFVASWIDRDVAIVTYENLLKDTAGSLGAAIARVTGDAPDVDRLNQIGQQFSFENQAKRKPGEEDTTSFLRKGVAGDWRTKFTREAAEVFDAYAGHVLVALGYESDNTWVYQLD